MGLSRAELFERIRRDRRVHPAVSIRTLCRRCRVHRLPDVEAGVGVRGADAARDVLWRLRLTDPGMVVAWATRLGITLKTVPRPRNQKGSSA
ncbi:hypothetical protein GCM10023205_52840 [Yinghuangia aomiensis]|uniref:Winged helix-turn helix n=1 Tax=Yinghuangia aomiensis TaxID=676205 RepID=A0ABP9HUJ2_9ACTN